MSARGKSGEPDDGSKGEQNTQRTVQAQEEPVIQSLAPLNPDSMPGSQQQPSAEDSKGPNEADLTGNSLFNTNTHNQSIVPHQQPENDDLIGGTH